MRSVLRSTAACLALATALLHAGASSAAPQAPPSPQPAAFDAVAATNAYLATVAGEQRARSDAYFEGGYWLQLWDFLLGVAVNLALLASGLSRRMRELAERATRLRPVQTLLYWMQYLLLTSLVLFPMTVYESFFREHAYGLSNQTFAAWLADALKALGVGLVLGGLFVTVLYAVVRRLVRTWALWGAVAMVALVVFAILIGPVFVAPLFNRYTRLADPVVEDPILSLARAQGVAARDVWVFDASRQSKRVSANVSGFAGTMRISLNDNLLNRCSLAEIEAVMGHEVGHYVLHHIPTTILFTAVVIVIGFALLKRGFEALATGPGARWGIRGVGDPAGLPLALVLLSTYFFVLTPVLNSWTRTQEAEADLFGINASGQPDGEARVDLMLGEYRKLDPRPLEEVLFFDHPSGRSRILMAMRWKAEHLAEAAANAERAAAEDRRRGWSTEKAEAWAREHAPR
ncbi:MAG TPA: M48 family metallopeptidase [Vicinamibacteria bacterium]|nr:M48 family metallopeptidase [Vicinamibacteria bacterium]